jgi:hypothetical protein
MEGMPAFEIYPMICPVVGSVELLTEANIPGTLVTTELQVRALSALVKRRLTSSQKSVLKIVGFRRAGSLLHQINIVVRHLHDFPLFVG